MSSGPLVSVVMPSYNVEAFLAEAVASVLRQTWSTLELLVVDDGSTDGTGALADRLAATDGRIRVVHQPNRGVSAARNAALAVAGGEYLCFLDPDDVFLPDKLRRQVEFLELFPACDLVFSDHYASTADLAPTVYGVKRPPRLPMREVFVYLNWFGPPLTTMLRRALQQRVGGFDESLGASEDWDFWIRASRCGTFAYLPGAVGVYRQHATQTIRKRATMRSHQDRVIDLRFERGSREWHHARASRCYGDAKWHYAQREWGEMLRALARCAGHARSLRTVRRIQALLSS